MCSTRSPITQTVFNIIELLNITSVTPFIVVLGDRSLLSRRGRLDKLVVASLIMGSIAEDFPFLNLATFKVGGLSRMIPFSDPLGRDHIW